MEDILGQLTIHEQMAIHEVMRLVPFERLVGLVGQRFDRETRTGYVNPNGCCVFGALFPEKKVPAPWGLLVKHWLHIPTQHSYRTEEEQLISDGIEAIIQLNDSGLLRTTEAVASLLAFAPDYP